MSLIDKIIGTHSERELKRIYPIVDKIEKTKELSYYTKNGTVFSGCAVFSFQAFTTCSYFRSVPISTLVQSARSCFPFDQKQSGGSFTTEFLQDENEEEDNIHIVRTKRFAIFPFIGIVTSIF